MLYFVYFHSIIVGYKACDFTITQGPTVHFGLLGTKLFSLLTTTALSPGRVVSGYKINKDHEWILLGKKDPQLPQMFYPVAKDAANTTITKGDRVVSGGICDMH